MNDRRRGPEDVGPDHGARPLRDLVATEAPLPARRAAAVVLTVARGVRSEQLHGRDPGRFGSSEVTLHHDGSVGIHPDTAADETSAGTTFDRGPAAVEPAAPDLPGAAGAALGRLLFELLVGRPPLDRTDALEPAITDALAPADCALLARSCSDAAGQWPSVDEWVDALTRIAGAQAPPLPPSERARQRRRARLIGTGVAALAVASVLTLVLTPRWWRGADERRPEPAATSSVVDDAGQPTTTIVTSTVTGDEPTTASTATVAD